MSNFASLGIGVSALSAAQRAVETAAHNVANAGTTGYTRQRLAVQTALPTEGTAGLRGDGMRGMGVTVVSIDRLRDRLADVSWRSEASVEAASSARADGLSRTESVVGNYGGGTGEALSRFLAAWDGLTLAPSDAAARSTVLSTGAGLADSLRASAQGLDTVSAELGTRIGDQLGELNGLLTHVDGLNKAILRAEVGGSDPNDLYDQRDNALDRITSLSGASVRTGKDGVSEVFLGDVPLLAGGVVAQLRAEGTGAETTVRTADGTDVRTGGQLGGYLSVLTSDLPLYSAQLDALATGLRDRVNEIHGRSKDLDGGQGGDFFVGSGARDLALSSGLTERKVAASLTGRPDDGEGALAMSALRTQPAVDGQPLGAAVRAFGARVGQAVTDANRSAGTAKAGLQAASLTRASANGVNIDEEMVDLVKYQHAYSAASRVITIVDEMLEQIINRMAV